MLTAVRPAVLIAMLTLGAVSSVKDSVTFLRELRFRFFGALNILHAKIDWKRNLSEARVHKEGRSIPRTTNMSVTRSG